jgi:hypothetical protein
VAPVNETDMVLLPEGLKALKQVAKEVGVDLRGAYLNLDGGFDSTRNRKCIFNAGLIPNIKENPRNRKTTKRGRKRLFNAMIHALRMGCGSFATTPRTLISVSRCVLCCHPSFPPASSCNVGRAMGISENFAR